MLGYDSLSEFPYTAAIINETLRLFPPLPALLRESLQDTQVKLLQLHEPCLRIPQLPCAEEQMVPLLVLLIRTSVSAAE